MKTECFAKSDNSVVLMGFCTITCTGLSGTYKTHNMDGRAFIREVVRPDLISHLSDSKPVMVIMNLPALAETFLDAFIDLISIDENSQTAAIPTRPPIVIYCYCFSKGTNVTAQSKL